MSARAPDCAAAGLSALGVYWETFGYDRGLYSNYQIERTPAGSTRFPFVGVGRIPNRDYVATLTTPQWSKFNATLLYVGGQDENFFEWAQANIDYLVALAERAAERPAPASTARSSTRTTGAARDHSLVGRNVIPRVKLEYQLTRAIFMRLVGEYDLSPSTTIFATRRGRSFRCSSTASSRPRRAARSLHGDYLFSYQPNPGTVLFLGYGSAADGLPDPTQRFNWQPLERTSDYFFVKYSYLFRM